MSSQSLTSLSSPLDKLEVVKQILQKDDPSKQEITDVLTELSENINESLRKEPPLSDDEVKYAVDELVDKEFLNKFRKIERSSTDKNIPNSQTYSLVSFMPSKGATPDSDGVYGMLKVRGTFQSVGEADDRAEDLIRNSDSYHSMYHIYTGFSFPLAKTKKYIRDTKEIDISSKASKIDSEEIRSKRNEEKKIISELKNKEDELRKDIDEDKEEDELETYIQVLSKKSQLSWTYDSTVKKLEDMKKNIIKARELLKEYDSRCPEYRKEGMERFFESRKKIGLSNDDKSFLKYLAEDLELDF